MIVTVRIDDATYQVSIENPHARPVIATVDGEQFEVWPEMLPPAETGAVEEQTRAAPAPETASQPRPQAGTRSSNHAIYAPIPGVIDSLRVQPGALVRRGDEICVLEAMKMKNTIRAPRDGRIAEVYITVGQHVRHHDVLMIYGE